MLCFWKNRRVLHRNFLTTGRPKCDGGRCTYGNLFRQTCVSRRDFRQKPCNPDTQICGPPRLPRPPTDNKEAQTGSSTEDLAKVYSEHVAFVWRNLRRMGIPEGIVDDATQDVFLVVHRRLAEFGARSELKTWLFGIVLRVGRNYRRSWLRRKALVEDVSTASAHASASEDVPGPEEFLEGRQTVALVHSLLNELDDDKRAILILVELEQMSVMEAAEVLGLKTNTAYSRLRAAHRAFEAALARHKAREAGIARKLTP